MFAGRLYGCNVDIIGYYELADMSDLTKRLRGNYSVGHEGVYEDRNFGTFTPAICSEAADYIQELETFIFDIFPVINHYCKDPIINRALELIEINRD